MTELFVQRIHPDAKLPVKSTTHAAAYDVCAYLTGRYISTWRIESELAEPVFATDGTFSGVPVVIGEQLCRDHVVDCLILRPGERAIIPTGLKIATDVNHCTLVLPRSGLSIKQGLTVINAPGLIDPDYRDELMILIVNLSNSVQTITHGDRIAQLRVERIIPLEIEECDALPGTTSDRVGGLGSTGVSS